MTVQRPSLIAVGGERIICGEVVSPREVAVVVGARLLI
jgi:hypothetical protein